MTGCGAQQKLPNCAAKDRLLDGHGHACAVLLQFRTDADSLGPDGHQARGGMPMPPGPGLRRMFAGGRVWRHGALRVGAQATRRTWQASSERKQGRSGPLTFVGGSGSATISGGGSRWTSTGNMRSARGRAIARSRVSKA